MEENNSRWYRINNENDNIEASNDNRIEYISRNDDVANGTSRKRLTIIVEINLNTISSTQHLHRRKYFTSMRVLFCDIINSDEQFHAVVYKLA